MENVEQAQWVAQGPMAAPGIAQFKSDYSARWGQDQWDGAAISWSVMIPTIVTGLKAAGTVDTTKLVEAILAAKTGVPVGTMVFGGGDVYGAPRMAMAYMPGIGTGFWKDGKWQIEVMHSAEKAREDQAKAFALKTK